MQRLADFGVLCTSQIKSLYFPQTRKTTMLRRLRRLEKSAFVRRRRGRVEGEFAWSLGPKGAAALGLSSRAMLTGRASIEHDVLLSQVRLSLLKAGLGENWRSEESLKRQTYRHSRMYQPERAVIPDGLFTAPRKNTYVSIALELELTAKKKERYRKIFSTYALKSNIWLIWYLVENANLGGLILEQWKKIRPSNNPPYLGWSLIKDVLNCPQGSEVHFHDESRPLNLNLLVDIKYETPPAHSDAHSVSTAPDSGSAAPAS